MAKIILDPGHGGTDPGAQGNGLVEKNLALEIARATGQHLQMHYSGATIRYTRTTDQFVPLSDRANQANKWEADLFVSFHHNAGGGSGFESYTYLDAPQRTKAIQAHIHNRIVSFLSTRNIANRGIKKADFAVLRKTRMPAILLENLFLDNPNDANLLQASSFQSQLALHISCGIAEALQLTPILVNLSPRQSAKGLYRVQTGSFSDRKNAQAMVQHLKQKGFDGTISYEKGRYKVQAGAFAEKEHAENLATRLRQAGFETYIWQK